MRRSRLTLGFIVLFIVASFAISNGVLTGSSARVLAKGKDCPSGKRADANGDCIDNRSGTTKTIESCGKPRFFGLVPWYEYLPLTLSKPATDGSRYCEVQNFTLLGGGSGLLLIALAIVDDLLRIAGIVSIVFIIVGGFKYITSQGNAEGSNQGRSTIINALIGLVIALLAINLVSFLGHKFGG